MPLILIKGDITTIRCDAIVNAANPSLLGGGGVDGAIHRAAGPGLLEECRTLGGCARGEAKLTKGYALPCRYVIHTVGPIWEGGGRGEEALLRSCYRSSLSLAAEAGCESVSFPLISAGVYGYPKDQALKIAVEEIKRFILENETLVYLVIYDKSSFVIDKTLLDGVSDFIDEKREEPAVEDMTAKEPRCFALAPEGSPCVGSAPLRKKASRKPRADSAALKKALSLEEALGNIDESFTEMLLRKIDESGMTDAECYKKANIDRKLFSKIRSDRLYRPSKATAIAFAIALELPLPEAKEMLMKAGYALSRSSKFDIIIEYFITAGNYDIFEINEALFAFDQPLLGA